MAQISLARSRGSSRSAANRINHRLSFRRQHSEVKHPRLGEIAEADHYLCRRLTRWKDVARKLAVNPQADRVIALDPEGIYRAIKNDRRLPKILARNPMYYRMIGENPDLGKILSTYM